MIIFSGVLSNILQIPMENLVRWDWAVAVPGCSSRFCAPSRFFENNELCSQLSYDEQSKTDVPNTILFRKFKHHVFCAS